MISSARSTVRGAAIEADVCIIGGGAAGISIALELLNTGLRVVLLEAGGTAEDNADQALYQGEVADASLHSPLDKYRQRRFGGSTTIWGGRCVPLDPIDFQARDWIPNSGWPISYHEVAQYYPRANMICEAGSYSYDAEESVPGGMRPIVRDFDPADFTTASVERFSCPTDFGRRYRQQLASSATTRVLLHANCTRLIASADGARIEMAEVRTLDGNCFGVSATQFVLATGALEVVRLLLASNDVHAAGVGNAHGLVGRYYMSHIAGTIGSLRIDRPADHIWQGYDRADDGVYCRRRIALRDSAQRRDRIGNIVFRLHHPRIPNPRHRTGALSAIFLARRMISYEYAKRLETHEPLTARLWLQHVANVGTDALGASGFLWHWLRDRVLAERKFPTVIIRPRTNLFSLDFNAEQVPNWYSHVRLADRVDPLGMPRLRVDWRYAEADVRTVTSAFQLLQRDVSTAGIGDLSLEPDEADIEAVIRRDGAYGGHHIGTARMGLDPTEGVVDGNCRVFGVNNLYIASSAVFPTSGQANPTLTIVALAVRLARHIHSEEQRAISVIDPACRMQTQLPVFLTESMAEQQA
ncbi:MAG TPA: GMC family oxidoreductase [Acetobacteraceae bacterium]|nr:GMC family oxidoreductase [Acetobacteraceae bacterium]